MAKFGSFEAVRDLDRNALRELLSGGDAAERVWAAWALGAILCREVAPDSFAGGDIGGSAGLRRHLLVILAGLGERAIIRVMAEGDPNAQVRAASCQYLIGTWQPDDTKTVEVLKFCLFADPASAVREEILKRATVEQFGLGLGDLANLANDGSLAVRGLVLALMQERFEESEIAGSGLFKRLSVEDDRELLVALGRMAIRTDGPGRVLSGAAAQDDRGCLALLDLLIGHDFQFEWAALNGLAARRVPAIDLRVLRLLRQGAGPVAFAWLAHAVAFRLAQEGVPDWDFIEEAWKPLVGLVDGVPAAVVAALRQDLEGIIRYAETIPAPDRSTSQPDDRRAKFVDLRRKLTGLIESASGTR